jgi:hypothetical protein
MNEPSFKAGKIGDLNLRFTPSAFVTAVLLIAGIFLFLYKALKWRPWSAAATGIVITLIHYLSDVWHQIGHARAAERSGFPMEGMTFVGPLALSAYPDNEGLLPAETHIQRALGGPIFSFLLTLASGLIVLLLRPLGGLPLSLAAFTFLDNLLVFTTGALMPLGFTDGSTILFWWDQRRATHHLRI